MIRWNIWRYSNPVSPPMMFSSLFMLIFHADKFEDISLNQWLALTPPDLVKAHLNIDDATVALFNKTEQVVV